MEIFQQHYAPVRRTNLAGVFRLTPAGHLNTDAPKRGVFLGNANQLAPAIAKLVGAFV
jgi:hypothetical protein